MRRIHAERQFTSWTDREGAFCFQGRDTADRGARILQQMDVTASRLERDAGRSPTAESDGPTTQRNRRADAFFLLMTGREAVGDEAARTLGPGDVDVDVDNGPPSEQIAGQLPRGGDTLPAGGRPLAVPGATARDVIERPPTCSVIVRIDLEALLRGHTLPGEVCEIDDQGPIPVAMARDLANDSFLRLVFHRAGDIRAVSHFGRTINRSLRTALAFRDRCCVVPGCGVSYGLEIDHVRPFAQGGPTQIDNLAPL